ncbi:MAG: TauD/TfdA family dioxygenase, partial [Pseudomonadota bacterium]
QVIFFRGQEITPEQHIQLGRRFGSLHIHPYVAGLDDYPEIIPIIKEATDKRNFGGGWHSDVSFEQKPALGSLLYAHEVPEYGGDTLFSSQYLAYETLSDGMKNLLDPLQAIHSAGLEYSSKGASLKAAKGNASMQAVEAEEFNTIEHPVVRTHPETGRKALYVNRAFTLNFKNMTRKESLPLLHFLWEQAEREAFTCRFRWSKNALAFWDNRCVQHYALNDYQGQRREMHRVTVEGDQPF